MIDFLIALLLSLAIVAGLFYAMFVFPWPFWKSDDFPAGGPWG